MPHHSDEMLILGSVVMAAPHTTVTVVREQWIELADLVAEVARRQLVGGAADES